MSLIKKVAATVETLGSATLDDLDAAFPAFTRQQIKQALHNAKFFGLVERIKRGRALGRGKRCEPSLYGPAKKEEKVYHVPRCANSVWQLGSQA